MGKLKTKFENFRFKGTLSIVCIFALIAVLLFVELRGVQIYYNKKHLDPLPPDRIVTNAAACSMQSEDTLLLYSSQEPLSEAAYQQFQVILRDMKWGTTFVDVSARRVPSLERYNRVIVLLSDLAQLGDNLISICDWVRGGGNAYLPLTITENAYSSAIDNRLGILVSDELAVVDSIYVDPNFMVGGGRAFSVVDAFDSARVIQLDPRRTRVYAWEENEQGIPLIWEAAYGDGKFVVNNFGMCDKAYRGFFAASLSLLGDVSLYPVINGSVFYLDDFPSQIPDGNSSYIMRDYSTTIRDFYINIWWPDMMNLSDRYGIKYTGLVIESYNNVVDGSTEGEADTATFLNFGNMLLRKGGELGYHGYNHQPLALGDSDYRGVYDYKTWPSMDAMEKAFRHLVDFCDELFPGIEMSVYVPPSNLLAESGRQMLLSRFEEITTLSGIYLPDDTLDFHLLQEYTVDETGVVDQPRIISGCSLDDFMTMAAFSELNMHFINNHFTHPDDALDPDRGAELGWEELERQFDNFLRWLYQSAPCLRNLTGSEMSAAVQRFAAAAPEMRMTEDQMVVQIRNFYDEAQFFVRFNTKAPGEVTGGTLIPLTGNLYLLQANQDTVTVSLH